MLHPAALARGRWLSRRCRCRRRRPSRCSSAGSVAVAGSRERRVGSLSSSGNRRGEPLRKLCLAVDGAQAKLIDQCAVAPLAAEQIRKVRNDWEKGDEDRSDAVREFLLPIMTTT